MKCLGWLFCVVFLKMWELFCSQERERERGGGKKSNKKIKVFIFFHVYLFIGWVLELYCLASYKKSVMKEAPSEVYWPWLIFVQTGPDSVKFLRVQMHSEIHSNKCWVNKKLCHLKLVPIDGTCGLLDMRSSQQWVLCCVAVYCGLVNRHWMMLHPGRLHCKYFVLRFNFLPEHIILNTLVIKYI